MNDWIAGYLAHMMNVLTPDVVIGVVIFAVLMPPAIARLIDGVGEDE